ncbi:hypothetical protein P175DRAFT_020589 [Aspergillus ochraceoroseus IBT 24754]|uniref:Telomere-associated protein Rif1 N-terminal domain-containing protein n=1 Tax=Aspergillus ochraceoroseus IBT 24754 TaxID=1392256 RepID=A0A2T5M6F4_9EURO|nr:uncharacterized protein P175DRAFT_020589 [Aspergillus ochraceoroseus IBT 24754]PTU24118.1 hypothetical protein P175DRAFT_020589 [Aspergillus ochraceoroseus IBT 24754]
MVEVLGPLSARPPTPPRIVSRMLSEKDRTVDSPVIVQTPIESPSLTNGSTGGASGRQSKRVNFSPWTKYIKPPSFTNAKSKVLPPSNECKPTKSILKSTGSPGPVNTPSITPYTPESFAMLLESITQQLAGESTSSRIDAYMQFFGALRAYEKLPPEDEIVRKLGLITQFIQRDIGRDLAKGGPLDTNLVIQALKLSVVLVWHPQISPHLSDDFKLVLVEHSLSSLEDGKLPKSVMTHYLSVLSTQRFPAKILTNARITRILTMLHGLTNKVKGNAVVSQRLMIYERLFEQSKSAFVLQPSLWMDHLLSGLLHHIREVRIKAIELGFNAYMAFGPSPAMSKTLRDIFDRPLDNDRKLASEICERMSRMMASPESGDHVPQIWGVIVLLLRSKRFHIDQWQHFKEWVLVLQKCFNCSDSEIKSKAIGGWNRFVLVANISETTSPSLLRMLSKPILSQFERKKQEKHGSQPSQLAIASYYNLLYYAFRPSASYQQLDIVWEEYIAQPSSNIFSSVPSLSDRVAHALSHMLWSSQANVWSENRVNETKRVVPEELPSLDCKWVRSRITSVLKVFEDILKSSIWGPDIDKSNIAIAWVNLSNALSYSSSKEITPSPESMQAVAHVLGLLQRLWNAGPLSLNAVGESSKDAFFERFRFLSTAMIVALGSIPFTEKLLLKTADSTYQAANTPTHRHSNANNNLDSPILHLLRLISDIPGLSEPTASYLRLINGTLEAACNGRVTRGSRLELLRQCADLYPSGKEFHFGVDNFAQIVWKSTAQLSADCLRSFPIESARERDGSVHRDYDNLVKILSVGLKFSNVHDAWDQLIEAFIHVLRTERGDQVIATTVVDLADFMMDIDIRTTCLSASSLFNHSLSLSFLDHNTTLVNERNQESHGDSEFFFPQKLIELANRILRGSYEEFQPSEINGVAVFIESLASFLGSGVAAFRSRLLETLQESLALYLKDAARKLTVESGVESRILTACRALSAAVLNILQGALPHDTSTLDTFQNIICAGLGSSHASIARRFIDFWSSTFGTQNSLRYPEAVSQALQNLETHLNSQVSSSLPEDKSPGATQRSRPQLETVRTNLKDMAAESQIAFTLDAPTESPYSARLDSSPVTRGSESTGPALQQPRKSSPQGLKSKNTLHQSAPMNDSLPVPSSKKTSVRHSEVFFMIDNLRSSSPPTNTPRDVGFMTPPHLRNLRNADSETETPQTPTLPAVVGDNEDNFLGSSPTPGIRGCSHSVGSEIPSTIVGSQMDIDPPSSPPELELGSPDIRQKSLALDNTPGKDKISKNRKRRNRARRSKTVTDKKVGESSPVKEGATQGERKEEKSLRSRLRSSTVANNEQSAAKKTQEGPMKTMCREVSHDPATDATTEPSSTNDVPQVGPQVVSKDDGKQPFAEPSDFIADSCSEDMDTQAISQLEHDLVSAVDLGRTRVNGEAGPSEPAPVTRKRKREEEAEAARSSKERRRSSRLSTATLLADAEEKLSVHSKKQKIPTITSAAAPHSPTATAALLKKRMYDADMEIATPRKQHEHTPEQKKEKTKNKDAENQGASQKRRSSRISGLAGPDIPVDSPTPKKSPRSSRSSKQNKKRRECRGGQARSQTDSTQYMEAVASRNSPEPQDMQPSIQSADSPFEAHGSLAPPVPDMELKTPSKATVEKPSDNDIRMAEVGPEAEAEIAADNASTTNLDNQASRPFPAEDSEPVKEPGIKTSLRELLDKVKLAALDRDTVKEIDDLLFNFRVEVHEALRRHCDATS